VSINRAARYIVSIGSSDGDHLLKSPDIPC